MIIIIIVIKVARRQYRRVGSSFFSCSKTRPRFCTQRKSRKETKAGGRSRGSAVGGGGRFRKVVTGTDRETRRTRVEKYSFVFDGSDGADGRKIDDILVSSRSRVFVNRRRRHREWKCEWKRNERREAKPLASSSRHKTRSTVMRENRVLCDVFHSFVRSCCRRTTASVVSPAAESSRISYRENILRVSRRCRRYITPAPFKNVRLNQRVVLAGPTNNISKQPKPDVDIVRSAVRESSRKHILNYRSTRVILAVLRLLGTQFHFNLLFSFLNGFVRIILCTSFFLFGVYVPVFM